MENFVNKQCRPWSDATLCGIWSEAALFAYDPFMGVQVRMGSELTLIEKGDRRENDRVSSPESVPIHLKFTMFSNWDGHMTLCWKCCSSKVVPCPYPNPNPDEMRSKSICRELPFYGINLRIMWGELKLVWSFSPKCLSSKCHAPIQMCYICEMWHIT